ncbi:MAG: glyoxalase [Chlorobi bacterium]|jgi:PhnB protein|nr:glyoxalase [Chlorobiota bacterium]
MAVHYIPEGFRSITPYLKVKGASALIEFLRKAFDATVLFRMDMPDGTVAHASIAIGDSMIELADASERWPAMPCSLHFYLPDADAAYHRAIEAGATSLMEPTTQFYGDREGNVVDPFGNHWYLATHVEDVSDEQVNERAAAQMGGSQS